MGIGIESDTFPDEAYAHFAERLDECLQALERLLARPHFGEGPATVGAELELFLVGPGGDVMPKNLEVVKACGDPRLTVELNRFNVELNLRPGPLAGAPFTALLEDAEDGLACVRRGALTVGARPVAVGILPTLRSEDLGEHALTPLPRYRALNAGIRKRRNGAPLKISVAGEDVLNVELEDVSAEGANTSAQFHLRVPPARFADAFNAAQLATAPALAIAGNSPFFLGRRLWDETRVALFRQSTDDRGELPEDWAPPARVSVGRGWMRKGALELFAETVALHAPLLPVLSDEAPMEALAAGRVPRLEELRLQNGTVWLWNRAVFDPADGGHLRIELRALPAGPSLADTVANGAFLLGLTLGLAPRIERLLPGIPFVFAKANVERAAREGLDTKLFWPSTRAPSPSPRPILELLPELLDLAYSGLRAAGVETAEIERHLGVIQARAAAKITGARWQRRMLAELEKSHGRSEALHLLLERYLENQESNRPVHTWTFEP